MCIRDRGGGNFLLLKIIVEGGGENFFCVLRYRQQRSSFLLKLLPGLFSRSPMFSAKLDFSAVQSTAIIGENRVRKREVVYVCDHSTVAVSYTHLDVYKRQEEAS